MREAFGVKEMLHGVVVKANDGSPCFLNSQVRFSAVDTVNKGKVKTKGGMLPTSTVKIIKI